MKHFQIFVLTLIVLVFVGCSNSLDDMTDIVGKSAGTVNRQRISKEDAVDIANKVLKRNPTRGESAATPAFDYVMAKNLTRSLTLPDTLAYILNYPDNSGFVIVASDRRVYPVLAYSDFGNFDCSNEIAKQDFIDKIEIFMDQADPSASYDVSDNDFTGNILDGCDGVVPEVKISLGQGSPWNKYVIKEHPGCPVGCVAVATALVMSHSKQSLTYHNSVYQLQSIINAINKGQTPKYNSPKRIVNGEVPVYTYEQAVDSMAKLLYWIGQDVKMKYSTNGSGAFSGDAHDLCKRLGFKLSTEYADVDMTAIVKHLKNKNIIYMRGSKINGSGGHAWVCDGCYYCFNPQDSTQLENIFLHCDWGWDGNCNGYYSGPVFEVSNRTYEAENYFAIKIEY